MFSNSMPEPARHRRREGDKIILSEEIISMVEEYNKTFRGPDEYKKSDVYYLTSYIRVLQRALEKATAKSKPLFDCYIQQAEEELNG